LVLLKTDGIGGYCEMTINTRNEICSDTIATRMKATNLPCQLTPSIEIAKIFVCVGGGVPKKAHLPIGFAEN
jgi:hypothetical protein